MTSDNDDQENFIEGVVWPVVKIMGGAIAGIISLSVVANWLSKNKEKKW